MVHISFAVFADAANLSQEGKLNVLGIFDALHVGGFPAMHPRAHFVVRVKATAHDSGSHRLTLHWVNPRDTELWNSSGELGVEAGPTAALEMDLPIIAVVDLPLDTGGQYTMRVELDGEPVARANVFVNGPGSALPYNSGQGMVS
ncbi:MAG: hypothetical protein M3R65_02275 [Gemmatimonadota bacterium]|nr:hypothetical protein [Gemmatimonadota bacterium]